MERIKNRRLLQKSFDKFREKSKINEIYFNGQIFDAYSKRGVKASKIKNPVNKVGAKISYGFNKEEAIDLLKNILVSFDNKKNSVFLNKLGIEFSRYKERWDKLSRTIQTVNNDVENIHKTTEKITKRFETINSVDIKNKEYLE